MSEHKESPIHNNQWYPVNGLWYVPTEFPDTETNELQDGAVQVRAADNEQGALLLRCHRIENGKSVFEPDTMNIDEFCTRYRRANLHIDIDWGKVPPCIDTIVSQVDHKGFQRLRAIRDGSVVFDIPHEMMKFWAPNYDVGWHRYRLRRDGKQEVTA